MRTCGNRFYRFSVRNYRIIFHLQTWIGSMQTWPVSHFSLIRLEAALLAIVTKK